jgi:cell division protein FtsA
MNRNHVVGIDIGTYQIKVVVAQRSDNGAPPKILGTGLAESKGLRNGYIINTKDVSESIARALTQAEKTSGIKIKHAYLSVGGIGLSGIIGHGQTIISRADLEITKLDIDKAHQYAEEELAPALIQNRRILHSIPVGYRIDGKVVLGNRPLGMKGGKLEVKMLFITCLEPHLADLVDAVENLGIKVVDTLASPIAGSVAMLTKAQKIAGCVLANIGAETISIVVYENNLPISLEVFPIGSTDITHDIALGLKVPLEEAESIKKGAVTQTNVSKKKLDDIINARLSDMFELIEAHLKKIGRNGMLPAGIFITGGGSGVGTIEDFARASLRLPSKVAHLIVGEKGKVTDSTWAVAYGLCIIGLSSEEQENIGTRNPITEKGLKVLEWFKQFLP